MRIAAEEELAALLVASGAACSKLNDLSHEIDAENAAANEIFHKVNSERADMRRISKTDATEAVHIAFLNAAFFTEETCTFPKF